jgi:integrase
LGKRLGRVKRALDALAEAHRRRTHKVADALRGMDRRGLVSVAPRGPTSRSRTLAKKDMASVFRPVELLGFKGEDPQLDEARHALLQQMEDHVLLLSWEDLAKGRRDIHFRLMDSDTRVASGPTAVSKRGGETTQTAATLLAALLDTMLFDFDGLRDDDGRGDDGGSDGDSSGDGGSDGDGADEAAHERRGRGIRVVNHVNAGDGLDARLAAIEATLERLAQLLPSPAPRETVTRSVGGTPNRAPAGDRPAPAQRPSSTQRQGPTDVTTSGRPRSPRNNVLPTSVPSATAASTRSITPTQRGAPTPAPSAAPSTAPAGGRPPSAGRGQQRHHNSGTSNRPAPDELGLTRPGNDTVTMVWNLKPIVAPLETCWLATIVVALASFGQALLSLLPEGSLIKSCTSASFLATKGAETVLAAINSARSRRGLPRCKAGEAHDAHRILRMFAEEVGLAGGICLHDLLVCVTEPMQRTAAVRPVCALVWLRYAGGKGGHWTPATVAPWSRQVKDGPTRWSFCEKPADARDKDRVTEDVAVEAARRFPDAERVEVFFLGIDLARLAAARGGPKRSSGAAPAAAQEQERRGTALQLAAPTGAAAAASSAMQRVEFNVAVASDDLESSADDVLSLRSAALAVGATRGMSLSTKLTTLEAIGDKIVAHKEMAFMQRTLVSAASGAGAADFYNKALAAERELLRIAGETRERLSSVSGDLHRRGVTVPPPRSAAAAEQGERRGTGSNKCGACDVARHVHEGGGTARECSECRKRCYGKCASFEAPALGVGLLGGGSDSDDDDNNDNATAAPARGAAQWRCAKCAGALEEQLHGGVPPSLAGLFSQSVVDRYNAGDPWLRTVLTGPGDVGVWDAPPEGAVIEQLPHDADPTRRLSGAPGTAAVFTGADLLKLTVIEKLSQSQFGKMGIEGHTSATRNFHLTELRNLMAFVRAYVGDLADATLTQCILLYLRVRMAQARKLWQPQTMQRKLHNLLGAFAALPAYTNAGLGVLFNNDAEMRAVLQRLALRAAEAQPTGQSAVKADQLYEAMRREPCESVKVALLLQWLTASRVGDTMALRKEHLTFDKDTGYLTVLFSEGKGVRCRKGKYTVHTRVPEAHRNFLHHVLGQRRSDELMCKPTATMRKEQRPAAVNTALRRVDDTMTSRSIRRGALQAMSLGTETTQPVDLEVLQQFAGHLRPETTRRYCDWNRLVGTARNAQTAAALALAPSSSTTAPPRPTATVAAAAAALAADAPAPRQPTTTPTQPTGTRRSTTAAQPAPAAPSASTTSAPRPAAAAARSDSQPGVAAPPPPQQPAAPARRGGRGGGRGPPTRA